MIGAAIRHGLSRHRLSRRRRSGLPALLVCLLAIALLIAVTPADDDVRRGYVDAEIGETAHTRDFAAAVTGVDVGRAVLRNDYEPAIRSSAVFVVVAITAGSPDRDVSYTGIDLITADGRSYRARDEFSSNYPAATMPGFRTSGVAVFEVPPARLPGAAVSIGPDRGTLEFYAKAIRVDLGLSEDSRYATDPIVLPDATTEVIR